MPLRIIPLRQKAEISFAPPNVITEAKPVGLVADVINQSHVEFHRSKKYTKDDYWVHVSDLIRASTDKRFCAREHALSFIEDRAGAAKTVSPGMALLYCIGHAVQEHLTNDFISRSEHRDKVWGNWTCRCGNTLVKHAFAKDAGMCPLCQHPLNVYQEVDFVDPDYRITGHPDLLIVWNGTMHIYEIKTIDREAVNFETLEAPLGDHTIQATMYYWMARKMYERKQLPFQISPFIDYVYADRSNRKLFFGKPFKEFTKRASPYDRVQPMFANADALRESLKQMRLPPRICKTSRETRAKNCAMTVSCFGRSKDVINAT